MLRFFLLADVIANAFFVADLIAIHFVAVLADVIAIYVEDGKPHFLCLNYWQMLLPWWQMEWPPRVGDDWQMLLP